MNPGKITTLFSGVALFVIMPFIFSMELQDMEQSPRFLFLAFITGITSILSIVFVSTNSISFKGDKFYFIILLFLLIHVISFFRSINFGDGLFELLKMLLFYSLLFQFILIFSQNEGNKHIIFKSICISALLFIVFGIVQLFPGLLGAPEGKGISKINYSITSTLGNKNFFAETLLLMFPITLLSAICHRNLWRIISFISACAIMIMVAVLQTLSTWVAFIIAFISVVTLIYLYRNKLFASLKAAKLFYAGAAAVLIIAVITVVIFINVVGASQLQSRIRAIQNVFVPDKSMSELEAQNSSYERIFLWKKSLDMISDHPITGVGLGNWKILIPSYGMGSATYMMGGGVRFIHPHNEFLLIATESGVFGLLVFLVMVFWLLYRAVLVSKNSADHVRVYSGLAMIFGIICFLVISFFSLPASRFYPPMLWMLFTALIIVEYNHYSNSKIRLTSANAIPVLVLTVMISIFSLFVGVKRMRADLNISSALLLERKQDYYGMKRHLDQIDKKYFPLDATATPISWYQGFSNFYLGDREKAFSLFKEAFEANPYHLMVLNDLGTCYNLSDDAGTAKYYYQKALAVQPAFGDALKNLSIIYYNSGKIDSSFSTLVQHRTKINPESVTVFSTILMAKAESITSDQILLERFSEKLKKPATLEAVLNDIRQKGIRKVILNP